ncbi:MAG: chromosomal replication initiator protein DnaA [Chloroflexota bacterium]|nr:chromosomal replication initiator protein DnaA [Chloroflexota bacterium]
MVNGVGPARTAREIWQTALGQLELQVNRTSYLTYLKDTTGYSFDGQCFTIVAPNTFARDWLDGRLASTVKRTLIDIVGAPVDVRFVVRPEETTSRAPSTPLEEWADSQPLAVRKARLNPRYTFDSFIVGASNRLAHAAAEAVAAQPGSAYNPLFIWGGVGLGKTHLLHAIGHRVEARGLSVIYVTSETFTNEFIRAIRDRQNDAFREKYRSVDLLLIDDIQFLATKEQTQEEFFHTFNDLHSNGKQIVITSDRSPKVMPSLEDRLRSRFEWGLIADIEAPDFETRVAILEKKARDCNAQVPREVLELIAHKFQNNIRELEGSLNKALMFARTHGVPLTLEVAHQALLGGTQTINRRRVITPRLVIETVAAYYRVDPSDLRGKRRDQHITHPRHVAMYIIREETQCTYQEIGAELGKRDHSTVMHGCERIASELKTNQQLVREVNEIRTLLYQQGSGGIK